MTRSASERTSRRAASSPRESPLTAPSVDMAQFIASLLQRAPWRLFVTRTGKACWSTRRACSRRGEAPPRVNLPPPVTTYSPGSVIVADHPMTAPSTRCMPTSFATRSSGKPFCRQTTAPSGLRRGTAGVSAVSISGLRTQSRISPYGSDSGRVAPIRAWGNLSAISAACRPAASATSSPAPSSRCAVTPPMAPRPITPMCICRRRRTRARRMPQCISGGGSGGELLYRQEQLVRVHRLGEHVFDPVDGPPRGRADDDDRNVGQVRNLPFLREEREPVHYGHGDVEHDHVGPPPLQHVEGLLAMLGIANRTTDVTKDVADQEPEVGVVFDYQDIQNFHPPRRRPIPQIRDYMTILASVVARTGKPVQAVSARWSSGMHSAARIAAGVFISAMRRRMPKDVDLASVFHLCKAAVRPMMRQRSGSIVNLTSVVGEQGNAGQTVYSMAKAGLIGFTKSLARELGSRNIRVNAVSPGWIETDMTKELPEAAKKAMAEGASLGRAGTPREVAEAIAFLASDRAGFITGEVLRVNGGLYM